MTLKNIVLQFVTLSIVVRSARILRARRRRHPWRQRLLHSYHARLSLLFHLALCFRAATTSPASLSNEFIRIRVNPGPNEMGRFAVDTTGGDPSRSSDDEKVLIYGSREPWTSYTTVQIDGQPFIFGGATARAGPGSRLKPVR